MATITALDVISEYTQALADRNVDGMISLRSERYVRDFAHMDVFNRGPVSSSESQRFWHALFAAFPELDYEVSCTLAAEDVVATRWTFTATNSGPVSPPIVPSPLAATGRTVPEARRSTTWPTVSSNAKPSTQISRRCSSSSESVHDDQ